MSTIPKGYSAFLVMLLLVCAVLFASCGGGNGTSASTPTPTPSPTPTPTDTPTPTPTTAQPGVPIPVGPHPTIVIVRSSGAVSVHSTSGSNTVTIQVAQQSSSPIPYDNSNNTITFLLSSVEGMDVELTVPPITDLQILTSNSDITVDGVSGQMSLTADQSHVKLTRVTLNGKSDILINSGNIALTQVTLNANPTIGILITKSGNISFNGALDPNGSYNFNTATGDISLTLPSNAAFSISALTTSGSINSAFSQVSVSVLPGTKLVSAKGDVGQAPRAQVSVGALVAGSIYLYAS
jgi:hypothetical protein